MRVLLHAIAFVLLLAGTGGARARATAAPRTAFAATESAGVQGLARVPAALGECTHALAADAVTARPLRRHATRDAACAPRRTAGPESPRAERRIPRPAQAVPSRPAAPEHPLRN